MATVPVRSLPIPRDELKKFLPNQQLIKAFENMAQDVSITLPGAIETSIQGPTGGVVDNDVVVFDGVTGFAVKDSGVGIADLAKLASPHFTGVPTAPTASPGTNTTQLATTAFVSAAVVSGVSGPASSVDSDIALFNGATGKIIKDSGVQMSAVALLASPTFTGTPAAPTAAPGTSTTQLATTAFVTAADNLKANLASPTLTGVPAAPTAAPATNTTQLATTAFVQAAVTSTTSASFSAHNNGVAQSIPTGVATKLTFSTETFDIGSLFATSTWVPPASRVVSIVGNMIVNVGAGNAAFVAVYKNGAEFKRGAQMLSSAANVLSVHVSCIDIANGTDTYELWGFQNSAGAQNTIGNAEYTYFQGTTVQT